MADAASSASPYASIIAANTAAAPNPLAMAAQAQQLQSSQTQNQINKYDLATKQNDYLNQQFGALLQKPDLNHSDFSTLATDLAIKGIVPPDVATSELANVPKPNPADPAGTLKAYQQFALNHLAKIQTVQQQLDQHFGMPTQVNQGNVLSFQNVRQQGGVRPSGGPSGTLALGLSPGESTAPTPIGTTAGGQPIMGTRAQFVQKAQGGQPGQAQLPSGGNGQAFDAPPQQFGRTMSPQAGIVMGLPVGSEPAMDASGKQFASDQTASADYRARATPLETAIPLLEKLGPGYQGQVGQYKADLQRTYQSLTGQAPPDDPVKAYDELNKYLVSEARTSGSSGTNDQLAAAIAGNPSTKISNAGATEVAKTALALRRLKQAQIVTAQQQNVPPGDYLKFGSTFNTQQDPRAYAYDMMQPSAQQAMIKSLGAPGTPAYDRFVTSLQTAHKAGVLSQQGSR